jgi:(p)ppGpp synthase/HD superfamily hydrolase
VGLFGPEVLRIVEACSDTDKVPKPPWRERKEAYLARLLEEDRSVLLVSAADKLHNARSIAADLRQHGAAVWERFNAPLKEQLWYYRELVGLYRKPLTDRPALVDELERAVSDMEKYPESP